MLSIRSKMLLLCNNIMCALYTALLHPYLKKWTKGCVTSVVSFANELKD